MTIPAFQQPDGSYHVPDRITGLKAFEELQDFSGSTTNTTFIEVDVTKAQWIITFEFGWISEGLRLISASSSPSLAKS